MNRDFDDAREDDDTYVRISENRKILLPVICGWLHDTYIILKFYKATNVYECNK